MIPTKFFFEYVTIYLFKLKYSKERYVLGFSAKYV